MRAPLQPRTPRLSPGSAEKEMRLRLLSLRSLGRLLVPGGRVGRADHLGCHGTRYVRHGAPEAGSRTQYVQCVMPGGKPPCASGTCPTREAGTRSPCESYGGAGACVSARRRPWRGGHPKPKPKSKPKPRPCQLSRSPGRRCRPGPARCGSSLPRPSAGSTSWPPSRK